jgi:isocitrate/isopropylmalate dehydrogenase
MQDTPSVKTLSKELKQLSSSSSRWGEGDEDACAVETVLVDPANRTPDTGGRLSTQQMTEKIMEHL